MPFEWAVTRGPIRLQPLTPNENNPAVEEQGGFWSQLSDTYALGVYGQMKDVGDRWVASVSRADQRGDPNWNPLSHIPKGYEQYAEDFIYAVDPADLDQITQNIDENRAIRQRLSQQTTGESIFYGVLAGVFDPVNLINPSLKGLSFMQAAGKGAAVFGGINAAQELTRNALDPTSTNYETAMNIGMGFAVSGLISGGIGHFSKGAPVAVETRARAKAEDVGNGYAKVQAAVDGLAMDDVIDFHGQGVRVIDGATGKYDADGNYVRAFFRPKEAFEQADYQAKVAAAADSALGDVVPDGSASHGMPGDELAEVVGDPVPEQMAANDFGTGAPRAADAPAVKDAAPEAEDTIVIDTAAVLDEFDRKPWTSPRTEGIEPFEPDAFKTPQEWLNFVALHELNHKTTKKLPGETGVAYENRINRLAYDEVQAGRLPLSPTDSALEKLTLLPTPSGTLMRLAPRNQPTHDLAQGIAGDMATLMIANRAGRATTPGGSVFQRAQRWLVSNYVMAVQWRKSYVEYVTGKPAETVAGNTFEAFRLGLPVVGQARKQGKLSPAQFRDYVGRAIYDDQPFEMHGMALADGDMALVRQAAEEGRRLFQQFEAKARDLGMFEAQKRYEHEVGWREKANARDAERLSRFEKKPAIKAEIEARIAARTDEINAFTQALDEIKASPIKPAGEAHYFPRIYDIGKIRARFDDFRYLLAEAYGGDEAALERATETANRIIGEGGTEGFMPGRGGPRHMLSREIPLTNRELSDFIVHDVETVMGIYSRRMGAAIEMVNKYGSRSLDEQIDSLRAKLADDGFDAKRIDKIVWEMKDMRDRVLGNFHGKDPMSWDNRIARTLKNYGSLTLMGRGVLSQTMDIARTVATEGYKPLFQALHTAMRGEMRQMARGQYAKQAGEALELVNSRWMAQMIDNDSALTVTNQTALERGLAAAQSPFFQMNLMNPMTVIWKDFTSIMTSHMLLDEAQEVAGAVRAGRTMETLSKSELKKAQHLASWGIDLRGAQILADMPVEKSEGSGLLLANMEAWSGRDGERARDLFLGALSGNIRSAVVTPGPMQRAAIMDGVFRWNGKRAEAPLASLPFQLMSFTMASSAKLTHALLSGRDRNVGVSLAALFMGGMLSTWLKAGDNWDNMGWDEVFLQSFENSSIVGYLADVYKRVENLTGYGPRAALGLKDMGEDTWSDEVGTVAGPALGVVAGALEAFINPEIEERKRGQLLRRAIPFSGVVWWSDMLKEWSNWAADAGMIEGITGDGIEGGELLVGEDLAEAAE